MSLRNWPVSWRLIAVIVIALVMGLVFGGERVAAATGSATGFARVTQLASLGKQVSSLAQQIEDERDATAAFIAADRPAGTVSVLQRSFAATDSQAAQVRTLAKGIGASFSASTRAKLATALARIADLPGLRDAALRTQITPLPVIEDYSAALSDLFTLNDDIAQGSADPALVASVRTLGSLSRLKDDASQQRAILDAAFSGGKFGPGELDALTTAQAQQASGQTSLAASATPQQANFFSSVVAGPQLDQARLIEQHVIAVGTTETASLGLSQQAAEPIWDSDMSFVIAGEMRVVELQLANSIVTRSQQLENGARQSAVLSAVVTGTILLLVLIATLVVARSLVDPLRRLRAGALQVATVRLPERVRRLGEAADPDASLEVEPISVLSTDEIGQVARAFDQVHREAVRLAGNEAMLRSNLNAMFVSLSRRSQSLIERLARMIDSLELNEDDPHRLSDLFTMDHLVTRMRRNSENLLVLAGHENARKWSEPVPLADVTRAAASEIEQYDRVILNIQPGIAVSGQAVTDVVHLLAEIIENATLFSPRDSQVTVSGQEVPSGGVLLEVRDNGIGVTEARLAELNWRLDNPPVIDVSVSRHMGLFAVSHLAARHGVRVLLRAASGRGLTAMIWLPGAITVRDPGRRLGRPEQQADPAVPAAVPKPETGGRHGPGRHRTMTRPTAAGQPPVGPAASTWFRAKRRSAGAGRPAGYGRPAGAGASSGASWQAVTSVPVQPVSGDTTSAGLPLRVPQANRLPQATSGSPQAPSGERNDYGNEVSAAASTSHSDDAAAVTRPGLPRRSPELARSRLGGFQHGARRAERRTDRAGDGAGAER
jgi:signal transduction histidine kinase